MLAAENFTNLDLHRKSVERKMVNEGIQMWKQKQERARMIKAADQKEVRQMLETYWPFGNTADMKPRGLRNLRLEGLFPNKDYLNAKRFVGTLDLGRPGGGAPMVTDTGKKITRTREDPLLRFQFGSNDLRRCVDNSLRYKTNRTSQEAYKKELDKLVEEKKKLEERRKKLEEDFERKRKLSSDEKTLKNLKNSQEKLSAKDQGEKSDQQKIEETKEKIRIPKWNAKGRKLGPIFHPCKNVYAGAKNRKLSPLLEGNGNGIELVPIMAKNRAPIKITLDTTDVTNEKKSSSYTSLWNRQGSAYLRELTQQMSTKRQKLKEQETEELENIRQHFSTWDGFWGRPGHGAPRSAIKKQRLDRLLYPQMVPIGVH